MKDLSEIDPTALSNFKKAFDNPIQLQFFKTSFSPDLETEVQAMGRHIDEILLSIIYSKFAVLTSDHRGNKLYCMSGFIEQENRLPCEFDKIRIIKGRVYLEVNRDFILSEIGFEIIKGQPL